MNSNYVTLNYVRHTVTWNVIRHTLLTTEFFFEDAQSSPVAFHSTNISHRFGAAGTVGYQLTPHVTLGFATIHPEIFRLSAAQLHPEPRFAGRNLQLLKGKKRDMRILGLHFTRRRRLRSSAQATPGSGTRTPARSSNQLRGRGRAAHHQHRHADQFHVRAGRQEEARA